jgi:hypothetical protein
VLLLRALLGWQATSALKLLVQIKTKAKKRDVVYFIT